MTATTFYRDDGQDNNRPCLHCGLEPHFHSIVDKDDEPNGKAEWWTCALDCGEAGHYRKYV